MKRSCWPVKTRVRLKLAYGVSLDEKKHLKSILKTELPRAFLSTENFFIADSCLIPFASTHLHQVFVVLCRWEPFDSAVVHIADHEILLHTPSILFPRCVAIVIAHKPVKLQGCYHALRTHYHDGISFCFRQVFEFFRVWIAFAIFLTCTLFLVQWRCRLMRKRPFFSIKNALCPCKTTARLRDPNACKWIWPSQILRPTRAAGLRVLHRWRLYCRTLDQKFGYGPDCRQWQLLERFAFGSRFNMELTRNRVALLQEVSRRLRVDNPTGYFI